MQRRSLIVLLAVVAIASVVVVALATSGTIYTWEKTFEVNKPEIECEIEIGDHRIVECPVKIWVFLKLEDCCWDDWEDKFDDHWEDRHDDCRDLKDEWDDDSDEKGDDWEDNHDRWECGCQVNGTYSAHLYWWNQTSEDWEHLMHLQEDTNITLSCGRYMQMYWFVPKMVGEYKVVVNFTVDSETYTFTNED